MSGSGEMLGSERLYLLTRIGSERVAFPADAIEAVVPVGDVTPVPGAPGQVVGLVAIRSRVLTLLDTAELVGEQSSGRATFMALVSHGGHGYALALDRVDDVRALGVPRAAVGALSPAWRALDPALAELDGSSIVVVDPHAMIELAANVAMSRAA